MAAEPEAQARPAARGYCCCGVVLRDFGVVEEIGDRYGSWEDYECRDLKAALLQLEDPRTDRVTLKNFYSVVQGGPWHSTEGVAHLQDLGALDATDPDLQHVLILSYTYAPSNCFFSYSMYSLCCASHHLTLACVRLTCSGY